MFKLRVYDFYEKLNVTLIGPFYRYLGKSLYTIGAFLQADLYADDRC